MRRRPRILLSVTLLLLFGSVFVSFGQKRPAVNQAEFFAYGDSYFFEMQTMPGKLHDRSRVILNFRLSYDLLTFRVSHRTVRSGDMYEATPTLYVEAVAPDGVVGDHAMWRDTLRVHDYGVTNSKTSFFPGTAELNVRPGMYAIRYSFDDGRPEDGFTESTPTVLIDDFNSPSPTVGLPMFLKNVSGDTLTAAAIDGNAPFGHPMQLYVPLESVDPPKSIHYDLLSVPRNPKEYPRTIRSGFGASIGEVTLSHGNPIGYDLRYFILRRETDTAVPAQSYGTILHIPSDDLDMGDYMLTITYEAGSSSVTDTVRFELKWPDLPFSLAKPEYAIRALYPIANDATIDRLNTGNPDKQREALTEFWASKDPTPGTKYNEAMAEYYRRVDYAIFNFGSIGQKDGAFTDRGKIYILYGPPTDIDRELQPEGLPREVWSYSNGVNRKFIFLDESKIGEYRLVEYYDL